MQAILCDHKIEIVDDLKKGKQGRNFAMEQDTFPVKTFKTVRLWQFLALLDNTGTED